MTNLRKQYGLSSQLAKQNHLRSFFPHCFADKPPLPSARCCDVSVVPILRRSPTERTSQASTKPRRPTSTYRAGRGCLGKYNRGLIQRLSLWHRNGGDYIFAVPIKRFTILCIFFLHRRLFLIIDKEEVRVTLETSSKCSVWASKGMSVKMLYPNFALIELPSVYWKRNRSPLWALLKFFFSFLLFCSVSNVSPQFSETEESSGSQLYVWEQWNARFEEAVLEPRSHLRCIKHIQRWHRGKKTHAALHLRSLF